MTKQIKITQTEARFPLASLTLSELNPRQHVPKQDVIDMAESIWTAGLIQNLAGFAIGNGKAEIVAGGRRLRALHYLAKQHPDLVDTHPELANPMVKLALNKEVAEIWANTENIARRDLHPAEEIRAYGRMAEAGATPAAIASVFAATEKHVYRRLALAHLPKPIIDALAAGEISLSMAACFTICDDAAHCQTVLDRVRGEQWSDHLLKNLLKPDSVKGSDRRAIFVGEGTYKDAGGKIGGDLFTKEPFFDNPDILDGCFQQALQEAADALATSEGWKWVETFNESYFCSYSFGLEKHGRIYPIEGVLTEQQSARYDELAELAEGELLDPAGDAELDTLQVSDVSAYGSK